MGKFEGKKLLILGTSTASVDIVRYAQSEGAYVIVTDYLPTEKSEAKRYADETAMISTVDIDALCQFAEERKIDGIFCGVSEFNLLSVNKVAERLNLPCYFNMDQWDALENKATFKKLCEDHGVTVAQKYNVTQAQIEKKTAEVIFPVIVKPVDKSACIGVHICRNHEELLIGYKDAYEQSPSHSVIVEQYIEGLEFTVYYTVINGKCRLSAMGDKYLNREQTDLTPLPEAFLFPSVYLERYIKDENPKVERMINSLNIQNGLIFIQGVTDGNTFAVFEAGLRINGSKMYDIVSRINGINAMHMLVDYALTGTTNENIDLEDPYFSGKHVAYLYLLNKGGQIEKTEGLKEAAAVNGLVEMKVHYRVGDTVPRSGTLKQRHMRFCLLCDSMEELKASIEEIQDNIKVLGVDGHNMLLRKFDTDTLVQREHQIHH